MPSKRTDQQRSTDYRLKASEADKQKVGQKSEDAIKNFIEQQFRWALVGQRIRTRVFEVDLMYYEHNRFIHLIEVKTIPMERIEHALSSSQKKRMLRMHESLQDLFPTRTHLAVVSQNYEIQFFEDVLCDLI